MQEALISCGQHDCSTVYWYDPLDRSSGLPTRGQIPWPLEFICQSFSRKHVFKNPRTLDIACISEGIVDWENRCKWQLWYDSQQASPEDDDDVKCEYWKFRSKKRPRSCPFDVCDEAKVFFANAKEKLFQVGLRAIFLAAANRAKFARPKFLKLVFSTLRLYELTILP